MSRPTFLLCALLLNFAFVNDAMAESDTDKKPNVLFIAMDDLNDWIGCLGGNPQSKTPNLDRLAAKGMLFSNAHCPAPACNPCRSAVFTGRSPNRSGLYDNRQQMREVMPDDVILPQYFRQHGYYSAGSGKLLHYFIDADSWDEYFPKAESENPFPQTFYPADRPVSLPRGGPWQYVETDWAALDVTDEEYGGDWAVSEWIGKQLSKEHDKPFFLGCGIYRPHEPWFVPKKYFEPFPLDEIQLPPGYKENDLDDVPEIGRRAARNRYFAHIQEQDQWKEGIQGYLASIHFGDAMLGRVLDALEAGPNSDNTIVVLWSDHGWQLGEKEHWQKYTPWRAVTRVPLMIYVPDGVSKMLPNGTVAGAVSEAPVNLLSLFPTLLDLCGIPECEQTDGPSLLPLLELRTSDTKEREKQEDSIWGKSSITYLAKPGSFTVSGRSHRLIHYADGSEELYDIEADPYEWNNLVDSPDSKELLTALSEASPKEFAERQAPSVESLAKLSFVPATVANAPASKPDGNPFHVFFTNNRRKDVELFWMTRKGDPKSYGLIAAGDQKPQQTRPGAVWMIRDADSQQELGHFVVGDRSAQAVVPAEQPNVIVILTDDQGWADLGCQDQLSDIKTPNIDALAERGVKCLAGYVTSPQCSPSRAGLITGMHQQRFGIDTIPDMPLPRSAVTIAERLKPLGYRTGFVGKWHLEPNVLSVNWMKSHLPEMANKPRRKIRIPWNRIEPFSPESQGFDEYFWGTRLQYRVNFKPGDEIVSESMQRVRNEDFRIEVQTQAALDFIKRNGDRPFYLQLNYFGPHTPLESTEKYLERFPGEMPNRRRYALAMIAAIDDGVGEIVEKLQAAGQLDNTLIVFTSDNGAPLKMTKPDSPIDKDAGGWDGSLNEPWVGEKGMLSEGGIRVPMIWSLPSQLPQGKDYNYPVSTLDIAPTVLRLAGGDSESTEDDFDGIDMLPRFNSIQVPSTRSLYFRFWDQAAIRRGKWKYIYVGAGQRFLFNLESDAHETQNLYSEYPELSNSLHSDLEEWTAGLTPAGLPKTGKGREQNWYRFYFSEGISN